MVFEKNLNQQKSFHEFVKGSFGEIDVQIQNYCANIYVSVPSNVVETALEMLSDTFHFDEIYKTYEHVILPRPGGQ